MHPKANRAGMVFSAAAAVAAAALTDPIVEGLSNAGAFGPGRFTDHSNLDVVPALCVAGALALTALLRWLRIWQIGVAPVRVSRGLPAIFAMQIVALFGMETIEQFAVSGHALGGTVWLGGPVAVSLAAHALACVTVTWLLSRLLGWSARTIVRVVRVVMRLLRDFSAAAVQCLRRFENALPNCSEPCLRVVRGRAPPSVLPVLPIR